MKRLTLLACLLLLPTAIADHPGSQMGLARFGNPADVQYLVHNVATVDLQFQEWESEFPDYVETFTLGETEGGLALPGIIITNELAEPAWSHHGKLKVYVDGSHHGNEYLSTELIMYYIEELLDKRADGAASLLASTELHIVPILNAEGNLRDTRVNFNGYDPNRNYELGHSPCTVPGLTCGGPEPFSESEIAANAEYVRALSPDLWISAHTGIALLYYNAGEPYIPAAPDQPLFSAMEPLFEAATNGRIDMTGGPAPAVGSADDWGYSELGTPTFTYEVHEDQFLPVYGEPIPDILEDQLAGMRWLVENTRNLGAWVDVQDGFLLNSGLGNASNLIVTADGVDYPLGNLAPNTGAPLPEVAGNVTWSYNALLVESSRVREHAAFIADDALAADAGENAPLGVVVLIGALLLARRR